MALLNSMLPTCHEEVVIIHDRLMGIVLPVRSGNPRSHIAPGFGVQEINIQIPRSFPCPQMRLLAPRANPQVLRLTSWPEVFHTTAFHRKNGLNFFAPKVANLVMMRSDFICSSYLRTRETQPPTKDASEKGFVVHGSTFACYVGHSREGQFVKFAAEPTKNQFPRAFMWLQFSLLRITGFLFGSITMPPPLLHTVLQMTRFLRKQSCRCFPSCR